MAKSRKKVLVLGGGFAGVECARRLESYIGDDSDIELVMVSEDNFLLFTPMLPQVASGMIETRHVTMPIRAICKNTTFYEGRVRSIDPHGKTVVLWGTRERRGVTIHYDFLVVALGSETNFFGLREVERHAYTMKTLDDAVMLRNRVIDMLEQAENEANPILLRGLLTFVVVGGGFAGVETAGELIDLLQDVKRYYPHVFSDDIRVMVLEALPAILPGFSEKLAKFAHKKLEQRGVEILVETAVVGFDGEEVTIRRASDDESDTQGITTRTLIWTAGVTPVNTIKRSVFKTERGKMVVNAFLEVPDMPGVFAIGDCAFFIDPKTGRPFAPTAQIAEAQARTAAYNLHALLHGRKKRQFVYRSRGQMAVIGKRMGIASVFGANVSGFWAWVLWRNIYLSKIPSMEKRVRVMLDWFVDLFFGRDISRLKLFRKPADKDYQELDEVDEVW